MLLPLPGQEVHTAGACLHDGRRGGRLLSGASASGRNESPFLSDSVTV